MKETKLNCKITEEGSLLQLNLFQFNYRFGVYK